MFCNNKIFALAVVNNYYYKRLPFNILFLCLAQKVRSAPVRIPTASSEGSGSLLLIIFSS